MHDDERRGSHGNEGYDHRHERHEEHEHSGHGRVKHSLYITIGVIVSIIAMISFAFIFNAYFPNSPAVPQPVGSGYVGENNASPTNTPTPTTPAPSPP